MHFDSNSFNIRSLFLVLHFLFNLMPKLLKNLCYSSINMLQVPVDCKKKLPFGIFLMSHLQTKYSILSQNSLPLADIIIH